MASHRFYTMTFNLMLLFCLFAIHNNHVTLTSARQLKNSTIEKEEAPNYGGQNEGGNHQVQKNSPPNEKEEEAPNVGGENNGANHQVIDGPSKNNNNNHNPKPNINDQKQFPFPFPFPFPPIIPGLPMPPLPLLPPPLGIIPGVPFSFPFPPLDIPGVMPSPP